MTMLVCCIRAQASHQAASRAQYPAARNQGLTLGRGQEIHLVSDAQRSSLPELELDMNRKPGAKTCTQNGQKMGMNITPSTQKIRFKGKPTLMKSTKRYPPAPYTMVLVW